MTVWASCKWQKMTENTVLPKSLSGALKALNQFRHGVEHSEHERKTLHRKSKQEHKQRQCTRTELTSRFEQD